MSRPETITSEYVRGFRAGESSALERAAQTALSHCRCPNDGKSPTPCMTYTAIADAIRALASPAAAPATETGRCPAHGNPEPCLCCEVNREETAPPSEPVAPSLLPRVLAALEDVDGGMNMGCASLAAELRRYIADRPAAGAPEESPK